MPVSKVGARLWRIGASAGGGGCDDGGFIARLAPNDRPTIAYIPSALPLRLFSGPAADAVHTYTRTHSYQLAVFARFCWCSCWDRRTSGFMHFYALAKELRIGEDDAVAGNPELFFWAPILRGLF